MNSSETNRPDLALARRLNIAAWIISVIVLILVASMRRIHFETSLDFSMLPGVHAMLNTVAAVLLILAYVQIRRKNIENHRRLMISAISVSTLFLVSYVVYHTTTPETAFCRDGWIRPVYFAILITHVALAAIIFPFILFTLIRALTGQFSRHRTLARWVFPIWLYVAVTGPVVYLMLRPCYE